ncbi:hypothetical protein [Cypionkella sp.]|uniref:hypothetical protein n=1 Tax=Cypionkella sp. TaxID=2811411 RepID=UPI002AC9B4A1|nr:hypothetical protein [Cypionkella sp.]
MRNFVLALGRLNPWIAALLVATLLQYQQVALHTGLADQISTQPVSVLTATPKFAVVKPAPPETRVRLIPLLDALQLAPPPYRPGHHRLRSTFQTTSAADQPRHGWQARAPPALHAALLI